ncbi:MULTISPECIES: heparinase II/III-family protein [unclassified Sinorhizobium]|uniref:heparinase II/III family protein n=1 Tax=unclassified Sinorhizobium TaxID=2613772 RepID=UPI0035262AE0
MTLGWYINRLRSMEPAEVAHRLREHYCKSASRGRDESWASYPGQELHPVLPRLRDQVLAATPAQRQAIAAAACETLSGRFSALGREWPERAPSALFPDDLWRLDPVTGKNWPGGDTYCFDINFRRDGQHGDIKYAWEINRLQMLPPLGAYLLLDGDNRARDAIETAIASWHRANPPFRGIGWASGIEVALRAISLIVTLAIAGERLGDGVVKLAGEILAASAYWLKRFPSKFSSANNHRIAELAGLYLIGRAFGNPAVSARIEIAEEASKQLHEDGTGAEQSPTYAAFSAELLLLCALAARDAGDAFPATFDKRLLAFADFINWIYPTSSGFGDDDEGRVLTLGGERDYCASVASAIRGFFGAPGIIPPPDDFRTLVFGAPSVPIARPRGLKSFLQGGLSVWHGVINERQIDLRFDHGPLGYLSIAAHGHADALSLTLDVDGQPVLVDPGTWLYGSGGAWRNWFRSTPAHNTLNINSESQSVISGAFNWSHKARTKLTGRTDQPDWSLTARHDGYLRRFGVFHERRIMHQHGGIRIEDRLIGANRDAEIVFQLAPGLGASRDHQTITISHGTDALLAIQFPDGMISTSIGGDTPGKGGWVSPNFGSRLPAGRISWRGPVGESGIVITLAPIPRHQR